MDFLDAKRDPRDCYYLLSTVHEKSIIYGLTKSKSSPSISLSFLLSHRPVMRLKVHCFNNDIEEDKTPEEKPVLKAQDSSLLPPLKYFKET